MPPDDERRSDRDWFAVDAKGSVRDRDAPTRRGPPVLGILVAALVVGVGGIAVADRLGASDPPRPSPSASTPPARTPTPTVSLATTGAGRTATSLGHSLLGVTSGWDLFARGPGVSVRLEMARGRIVATTVPSIASGGPVYYVVGADRVLIRPLDAVQGYVVPDDAAARATTGALALGGPVVPGPDPAHVWVQAGSDQKPVMSLVALDGSSSGRPPVPVPPDMSALSVQPDGAGSLLFEGTNGTYAATGDGLRRITTGHVVASSADAWLVSDCDDRHRCSTALVDRGTGARRGLGPGLVDDTYPGAMAPDGRFAAVPVGTSGGLGLLVIDLASGARRQVAVALTASYGSTALAWSPDSRWLMVVAADQSIRVVDPATLRVSSLGLTLPPVEQVAVRP